MYLLPILKRGISCVLALAALAATADAQRLGHVATTAQVGTGTNVLTGSFVIGTGSTKTVLIRALGPALQVSGSLATPVLTLYNSSGTQLATNSAWNASDAGSMSAAGASALTGGSKDAAIVATLSSGVYTVQVAGSGTATGLARLEFYEVSSTAGSTPLSAVATRAGVNTSGSNLSTQITITGSSGTRRILMRAAGPELALVGVTTPESNPSFSLANSSGTVIATNDDWGTPLTGGTDPVTLADYFVEAGASLFLAGSTDSALVTDLAPGTYTLTTSAAANTSGLAQVEVYDVTPAGSGADVVSFSTTSVSADNGGTNPGVVVVTRSGDTSQAIIVGYSVGGSAVSGTDYQALSGSVTIPAGLSSAEILVNANPSVSTSASEAVILSLDAGSGYSIGSTTSTTVTIKNLPATLYIANLRVGTGVSSSASGTATLLVSASGNLISMSLSFSNLSSDEVVAHITLTPAFTGGSAVFLKNLAAGQVVGAPWTVAAAGQYSVATILGALKTGGMGIEIDSANYSGGELTGTFVPAAGSQTFTAPAAAPAFSLATVSQADASRFLTQATFGPTTAEITKLMNQGYSAWIASQMAFPETSHLTATRADATAYPPTGTFPITQQDRHAAWWSIVLNGQDQLRQRVAFALSELFVTSDVASALANQPEALANYNDMLANDAFGNYRKLLEDVTLNPAMGNYLNMLRNQKANPAKGTAADENYAREVMQLFTIGLNQLQPDGTLKLSSTGLPIATYTQDTVTQTANVFTGWAYYSTVKTPSFLGATPDYLDPMMLYPAYHDLTQKTIVGGVVLPANQDGATDLKAELDTLFNHPNTGPFVVKQLIQRLVTSNPSPGYVYRVAQVFANDGTGTRGNLGAVVKAILLDYEARSSVVVANSGYGKLREPLLRMTELYRAFNAAAQTGRYAIFNPETNLAQAALRSPTVFNFFLPTYVSPGTLADAGLVAPEFQITTASTSISVPNNIYNAIYTSATPATTAIVLDLSALTASGTDPAPMIKLLSELFCGGAMSAALQSQITTSVATLPKTTASLDIARYALYLTLTSPEAAIQR